MRCEESSTPSPASNNRMNGGSRHPSDLARQEIGSVDPACSSGCNQAFTMDIMSLLGHTTLQMTSL